MPLDGQGLGIDDSGRRPRRISQDLIEDISKLKLVFLMRDVTDMRRAHDIGHVKQRVRGVA